MMPGSWEPGSACTLVKYAQEGGEEMPDLALCKNASCPSKGHCYRFTAEPSCHQVYAAFAVRPKEDRCDYYIPAQMEERK
jgi:hypothetical protein